MDEREIEGLRRAIERAVRGSCPGWLLGDADDIAQEATLKVVRILERREGEEVLASSYLWRAAHSAVVDEIRRRRRRREDEMDEDAMTRMPDARTPDADRRLRSRRLGEAIRVCLETLVAPRRRALVLHLQGHAVPEIASLLGWKTKRADNLVYRGLGDLRSCLTAKGYGDATD